MHYTPRIVFAHTRLTIMSGPLMPCLETIHLPMMWTYIKLFYSVTSKVQQIFIFPPLFNPPVDAIGNPERHVRNARDHAHNPSYYCLLTLHICMVLFFTHIPFVVNHTINATPPERLQHCVCWSIAIVDGALYWYMFSPALSKPSMRFVLRDDFFLFFNMTCKNIWNLDQNNLHAFASIPIEWF